MRFQLIAQDNQQRLFHNLLFITINSTHEAPSYITLFFSVFNLLPITKDQGKYHNRYPGIITRYY